jgi:hypothetical protein
MLVLSIFSFELGDYTNARDILLEIEPSNRQAVHLRNPIERSMDGRKKQ